MPGPCSQITAQGTPCKLPAVVGLDRCTVHAGLAKVGRPSLLTDETADALVSALRVGNYLHVACQAAGIARDTFHGWMERGLSDAPEDAYYRAFRERIEKARAAGQVRHVALISQAATADWRAAAFILERQWPALWGAVSVKMRDDAPPEAQDVLPEAPDAADPFAEVDELATRRRDRTG